MSVMANPFAEAAAMWARRNEPDRDQRTRWPDPGALAQAINPKIVQTPALSILDREVVRALRTPDSRTIITMPPQEGKSERVTKTSTLWGLIENPDLRFSIVAYNQPLAETFGREVRNAIAVNCGDEGTLDLGLRIARDNGSAKRWSLQGHIGGVICVGIGGGLTGRPVDVMMIDDPIKDQQQADSEAYRKAASDWFKAVAETRLAPGAPIILIQTRWHEDDLAGQLLSGEDKEIWRLINIPAVADHSPEKGEVDLLGREPGEWMESARRRSPAQWEAKRIAVGSRVFTSLYQGRPSPESGNVWKRQWWRRYDRMLWTVRPDGSYWVNGMDEVIQSWDCAFKDTKSSDWVVGQVWARKGADVYLLYQVRRRMSFTETVSQVLAVSKMFPQAKAKLVEDKANGTAVINTLKSKLPGLIPINPTDSKYGRTQAVSPFIEAGNVLLPTDGVDGVALFDDVESLIDEAAAFPNGTHDDQVDATSQALSRMLGANGPGQGYVDWMRQQLEAQRVAKEERSA